MPVNQISDISPLASLTSLKKLSLPHNQISDISPLASLPNLDTLWLTTNEKIDLKLVMVYLSHVTHLFIDGHDHANLGATQ